MLKLILISEDIMLQRHDGLHSLIDRLSDNNIKCVSCFCPSDIYKAADFSKIYGYPASDTLLISSDSDLIEAAATAGISCIGYLPSGGSMVQLSAAKYLAEGFEGMNITYLQEVYCRFHHLPLTVGNTPRLIIKELSLSNLPDLYNPCCLPYQEKMLKSYIECQYGFYGYGIWGVFEKNTGRLIGKCGIEHKERCGVTSPELGYFILQDERRKGYAFEASAFVLNYSFSELGFDKVSLAVRTDNLASIRLAEMLGMHLSMEVRPETPCSFFPYCIYTIGVHDLRY